MTSSWPEGLRAVRALCDRVTVAPGDVHHPLVRARQRLDRDLLPRTAGSHQHLVVGIVGPNNAGKSSLFNTLVGRKLSPATPTGGATSRLLAAAHPDLLALLSAEPTLAQFPLRTVQPGPEGVAEALTIGDDPGELLVVETADVPAHVLLIDTPDFDSIQVENRRASQALLAVADLAVVVVTRHTYQNREVVTFLESWLAHGRPWLLVYNESIQPEVTRSHAAKLAHDLGSPPVAVFHAAFDLGIQTEEHPLRPVSLDDADRPMRDWLFELKLSGDLKERALSASLAQLLDDLTALKARLSAEASVADELLGRAQHHAARLGQEVASHAMPMKPFLEAFRAVLDRRPNLLARGARGLLRRTRLLLESAWAKVVPPRPDAVEPRHDVHLVDIERESLHAAWAPFFEELTADLHAVARGEEVELGEAVTARLDTELTPSASAAARVRVSERLAEDTGALRSFQHACEDLIEADLEERGNEWFLQLAIDAVHLFPSLLAGIVIFHTGGLGWDVAIGGAGTLSSVLAERLSKLLGTSVARRARKRWTQLRGERLADIVLDEALPASRPMLTVRSQQQHEVVEDLNQHMESLPWPT
jgi:hypothetical protein